MTQDASPRLHLVTGNSVADLPTGSDPTRSRPLDAEPTDTRTTGTRTTAAGVAGAEPAGTRTENAVMADLLRRAEALDARVAAETTPRSLHPAVLVAAGAVLTVVLALLGRQPWQLPTRAGGAVADVPQSLVTFLLLSAALCVWAAGRLVRPAATLRSAAAVQTWWVLLGGTAVVSLAATVSLASFAGSEGPGDHLARCAVVVVPAVLAGFVARDDGRAARIRLALGTGLVTVPLCGLGWALVSSSAWSTAGLADVLAVTGIAAAAPLALAVAFVAADRRRRTPN
ncbi:hypothetical protein GCM10023328_35360 [Modestobacter marinus]|uniref:Uncharacterized protein n=1 Tax=Modestobacter marinus TaxID=477641 RepID=A0A846LUP2_9ACTN|nr:hypothetical protein [Modestobacter marinus]NIH69405.1 hypothetical protein [Modestobacter marinus]GGL73490.1 hypothetical protein GCM10011589_32050 [Modestobacter marinus]